MLIAGTGFFLGLLAAIYWSQPTAFLLVPILLTSSVIFLRPMWRRKTLCFLVCSFLGFVWADWHLDAYYKSLLPPELESRDLVVIGNIADIPEQRHKGWRFDFDVASSEPEVALKRIQLSWYGNIDSLKSGERWRFTVRLKRPHGYANPGGFDYEQWMLAEGIHGRGYVRSAENLTRKLTPPLRQKLWGYLQAYNLSASSLVAALVLGEKQGIEREHKELFQKTGTAHLFAISGLHVGMIAALFYWLTKVVLLVLMYSPLALAHKAIIYLAPMRICLFVSWFACAGYAVLAGFSIPTQRALIMLTVLYFAWLHGRQVFTLTNISAALLFVLLIQPLAVLNAGFWLSFTAVIWISCLLYALPQHYGAWRKTLFIQVLLPLCLWPITQYWFGESAAMGALANILLIPLVSFVVLPLSLLVCFLEWVAQGGSAFLMLFLDALYHCILNALLWVSAQSWGGTLMGAFSISQVILLQLGIFILLLPFGLNLYIRGLAAVMCLSALMSTTESVDNGSFRASVLDVGQGLSILIETREHALVYDTGPEFPSGFNTAEAVLLPYLNAEGIAAIDKLVLSHGDKDHSGGLPGFFKNIPVRSVTSGQVKRLELSGRALPCNAGDEWEWDGVDFKVLWPSPNSQNARIYQKHNNYSCVIRVTANSQTLLLTGDIEKIAEAELLGREEDLKSEVLVAAHHGSRTSTGKGFIDAVEPKYVVFSAGYRNRFRHPHYKIAKRVLKAGAEAVKTADCGRFLYSDTGVSCYRDENAPRWRMKNKNN